MLKFNRAVEYVIDGERGWYYQGDEYYDEWFEEYLFFNKERCWSDYLGKTELDGAHEYEEEN